MAKLSNAAKLVRSFKNRHTASHNAQNQIVGGIVNYWKHEGNAASLSFVYTALIQAEAKGYTTPKETKAITAMITKFCAVAEKIDSQGRTMYDAQGNVTLIKDKEKHDKKAKTYSSDNIESQIAEYLGGFVGGLVFNSKLKTKETEETAVIVENMTIAEKQEATRQAEIAEQFKKEQERKKKHDRVVNGFGKYIKDQNANTSQALRMIEDMLKLIGFTDLESAAASQAERLATIEAEKASANVAPQTVPPVITQEEEITVIPMIASVVNPVLSTEIAAFDPLALDVADLVDGLLEMIEGLEETQTEADAMIIIEAFENGRVNYDQACDQVTALIDAHTAAEEAAQG